MFASITEFLAEWEKEADLTLRILNTLTDESLDQKVTEEDRTLGRIAWHLVITIPEMMSKTGLIFDEFREDIPVPKSAKEIKDYFVRVSRAMETGIKDYWKDQTLFEEREMYGETWKIGTTLNVLINHQIHHRGQMTVLMRQAGLKVPGIYGPAREEWSQFGMEPPLI